MCSKGLDERRSQTITSLSFIESPTVVEKVQGYEKRQENLEKEKDELVKRVAALTQENNLLRGIVANNRDSFGLHDPFRLNALASMSAAPLQQFPIQSPFGFVGLPPGLINFAPQGVVLSEETLVGPGADALHHRLLLARARENEGLAAPGPVLMDSTRESPIPIQNPPVLGQADQQELLASKLISARAAGEGPTPAELAASPGYSSRHDSAE